MSRKLLSFLPHTRFVIFTALDEASAVLEGPIFEKRIKYEEKKAIHLFHNNYT